MKKSVRVAAILLPLTLVAAACGSDEKASEETAAPATEAAAADPAAEGVARAKAVIEALAAPPANISPTVKLTSKPEKKKVAWLECEQPSCKAITPGFKDATAALGWELEVIPGASFAQGPAIQQALDSGADYIAHTGSPLATAQAEIDAAKAKGVPYMSCYATDDPGGEANNLYTQCGDDTGVFANGGIIANWAIADSGGKANVLLVNLPDFPVLVSEADGAKAAYKENCPGCKLTELNVTLEQLGGGKVPDAIASEIQKDPSINYLQFTFGDLPAGAADTLEAAGLLEGKKIIGVDFSAQIGLPEIIAGRHHAWTANPKPYAAWLMVDAMARHAVGMDNGEERANALLPTFIISKAADAQKILDLGPDGWPGPDGMADQFKALWGV